MSTTQSHTGHDAIVARQAWRALSPSRWLAGVLALYALGMTIAPMEPTVVFSWSAAALWLGIAAGLWVGLRQGEASAGRRAASPVTAALARKVVLLAVGGVLLLGIDRYVVRGAPLELDFFAVRDALEGSPPGVFGMLAAFVGAFAPFGWLMCRLASAQGVRLPVGWHVAGLAAALAYVLLSVSAGSRTVMLVVVLLHVAAIAYFARLSGRRLRARVVATIVLLALAMVGASVAVMFSRLEQMGLDPLVSIQASGYAESLQPSAAALAWIESHPDSAPLLATAFSLALYVYHGVFEFALLVDSFADRHTAGALIFWLPLKLLDSLAGTSLSVDPGQLDGVREGLFTTFAGPVFIDFGVLAVPVAALLGWVLAYPCAALRRGHAAWLPAAATVVAVVVMFPVLNMIDSAAGAYLLVAGAGIAWLGRSARPTAARRSRQLPNAPSAGQAG